MEVSKITLEHCSFSFLALTGKESIIFFPFRHELNFHEFELVQQETQMDVLW